MNESSTRIISPMPQGYQDNNNIAKRQLVNIQPAPPATAGQTQIKSGAGPLLMSKFSSQRDGLFQQPHNLQRSSTDISSIADPLSIILSTFSPGSAQSSPNTTSFLSPQSPPGFLAQSQDSFSATGSSDINEAADILLAMKLSLSQSQSTTSVLRQANSKQATSNSGKSSLKSPSKRRSSSKSVQEEEYIYSTSATAEYQPRRRNSQLGLSAGRMSEPSYSSSSISPISPSLRHASSWIASRDNISSFELTTAHMDQFQRNLLRDLLARFGSKLDGLELVYKPATKRKPQARWIPKYQFQKSVWVEELWAEWRFGLNGMISLQELEDNWGSEWVLARKEVKHEKFRRMRVIREIRRLLDVNRWTEDQLMDFIHREITEKGINARKWGDSLPKQAANSGGAADNYDDFDDTMSFDDGQAGDDLPSSSISKSRNRSSFRH